MNLKHEDVTIDGTVYQVNELPIKVMMPIVKKIQADEVSGNFALMGASVSVNGQPLGDAVENLGSGAFLKLQNVVLRVSGLKDAAGNES